MVEFRFCFESIQTSDVKTKDEARLFKTIIAFYADYNGARRMVALFGTLELEQEFSKTERKQKEKWNVMGTIWVEEQG